VKLFASNKVKSLALKVPSVRDYEACCYPKCWCCFLIQHIPKHTVPKL